MSFPDLPLVRHFPEGSTGLREFIFVCGIFIIIPSSHRTLGAPTLTPAVATTELGRETCGQTCRYKDLHYRAQCNQRGLIFVPISIGCEAVSLLQLQENNITSITVEQMAGYTRIRTLNISRNQILFFEPGTFLENHHMTNFIASHNKLERILKGTFNGTEKYLQRIYLGNNNIQFIERGAFVGLGNLTFLTLQNNRLQKVPGGLFSDLFALKLVNLSFNQLHDIPPPLELGFHKLRILDIRKNQLNKSSSIVPFLYNSTDDLFFSDNPIVCDCDFLTIQKWFYKTIHSQKNQIGCKLDNETYVDVTDNLTIPCEETKQISGTLGMITSPSLNGLENDVYHTNDNHRSDDVRISRFVYKVPWISYYTAILLTIYCIFKFLKWIPKKMYESEVD